MTGGYSKVYTQIVLDAPRALLQAAGGMCTLYALHSCKALLKLYTVPLDRAKLVEAMASKADKSFTMSSCPHPGNKLEQISRRSQMTRKFSAAVTQGLTSILTPAAPERQAEQSVTSATHRSSSRHRLTAFHWTSEPGLQKLAPHSASSSALD